MQTNLFGETEHGRLTIEQAAGLTNVSTATIRNWIKTGYLSRSSKGGITQESHEKFLSQIAGKEKLNARANKRLKDTHDHEQLSNQLNALFDRFTGEQIGAEYENSLSNSFRNQEGIYYTPSRIVQDMLQGVDIDAGTKFLDPCCGSGNFLIEAIKAGVSPANIVGFDTDENAVLIARERIKQEFGFETPNIRVGDFLNEAERLNKAGTRFDLIFTNPPWGKKIDNATKKRMASLYGCGDSLDTASLFLGASFSILKPRGILGFLMQEAFFNIAAFKQIRKKALSKKILRLIDYGRAFKGLLSKAQAIILENTTPEPDAKVACCLEHTTHYRSQDSFKRTPQSIFNFHADAQECNVIERLYAVEHTTLSGKARWALGIVTGNNKKYCKRVPDRTSMPVYRGLDITKQGLKEATTFISQDFTKYQQVAPLELYRAKEKLIYRFISSDLCFYFDDRQHLLLNSANLLIPYGIGITGRQLVDLLNSEVMNWLFKKIFSTHKVLRGDLELLPIHTEYFSTFSDFSEEAYLEYLQITKTAHGTYSIKNEYH